MALNEAHHAHVSSYKNKKEPSKKQCHQKRIGMKPENKQEMIAVQIKLARMLASNDKKTRDKILKNLKKWLQVLSHSSFVFIEADFMCLWKGLFYCMWISDKMLIQEELAESLSKLVHCFVTMDTVVLFITCALKTLSIEWFGIDRYRLDKFAMLVRRIVRQAFTICKNYSWDMEWVTETSQIFEKLFLHPKTNIGFAMHVTDIYLEELAKVSDGNLSEDVINEFIKPFIVYLLTTDDERQMKHIMQHVFRYLIVQSDVGLEYAEKFQAWSKAGFPCTRLDDMQKVALPNTEENSETEDEQLLNIETEIQNEKPLDPRAGKVDVELPQIRFNAKKIVKLLSQYKHDLHALSTSKARRQLSRVLEEFEELSNGKMPLGVKKVKKTNSLKAGTDRKKAAVRLIEFEKNLFSDKTSKNRKRKRNEQLIEIDASSVCSENKEISDLNKSQKEIVDLKSKSVDVIATIKTNSQIARVNVVPPKKRKKDDVTCEKLRSIHKVTENKRKLETKLFKNNKIKKLKLKHLNTHTNKSIQHKTKKAAFSKWDVSDSTEKRLFSSLISQNRNLITENVKSKKARTIPKSNICDQQATPLKDKSLHRIKKPTNLNNSTISKKQVKIALQRNTAHNTSEYFQQIRRSPNIPFDANKKPSASVLKPYLIPTPVNPFYKRDNANKHICKKSK